MVVVGGTEMEANSRTKTLEDSIFFFGTTQNKHKWEMEGGQEVEWPSRAKENTNSS